MEKITAFKAEHDDRTLHHTARAAREAEFDNLLLRINRHLPGNADRPPLTEAFAVLLRSGIYPTAADAFIAAADYLREHLPVLTGTRTDPEEK